MQVIKSFLPGYKYVAIWFFNICILVSIPGGTAKGQAKVFPWGNMAGIRVGGQLMEFESSLRLVEKDWSKITATGKERQSPKYTRDGNKQAVTTKIDSVSFTEIIEDATPGIANVDVQISSNTAIKAEGIFFSVALPLANYSTVATYPKGKVATTKFMMLDNDLKYTVDKIQFKSARRDLEFIFDQATTVIIKKNPDTTVKTVQVYIPILEGDVQAAATARKKFIIKAGGYIDKRPVNFKLDALKEGNVFDGFGGNFRLQNPKADPLVIDYCLQNLRVAWGRVEFPWRFWQPGKDDDPVLTAKNGKLNPRVQQAMDMAVRLSKMGIPMILSGWFPPQWAVVGNLNFRPSASGVWGNQLDTASMNEIYKSITDYILYIKNTYGTEVALFSFNESDLGINVRQTAQEHAALIKGLGAYFKSKGLSTKMLLGDNSDATTYEFIYNAMHDQEAVPYIGAISFHSWRGWDTGTLEKWKDASDQLKVPLIVGEGSIDAAAWNYPAIFGEQIYIMQEISLYIRLLSICQPLTILQWQLTSDYSPLAGGGIFGNNDSLHPTQRFWNFKQLASTPKGLFAMPVTCDRTDVTCAALGDNTKGIYAIHIVNNEPARDANLTGILSSIKKISIYLTGKSHAMKKGAAVKVSGGKIKFHLDAESYITLIAE